MHQAEKWFNESLKDLSSAYYRHYKRKLKKDVLFTYKSVWYHRFGRFDRAIAIIDTLIQLKKDAYVDIYNLGVFRIVSGNTIGLNDIKRACAIDTTGFVQAVYDGIVAIKSDSLLKAEKILKQKILGLRKSGIAKGLLAGTLEKLGKDIEAKKSWFKCYGQLPLGTDVESMRSFIDKFIETISR